VLWLCVLPVVGEFGCCVSGLGLLLLFFPVFSRFWLLYFPAVFLFS
jgi:hypothetical protein